MNKCWIYIVFAVLISCKKEVVGSVGSFTIYNPLVFKDKQGEQIQVDSALIASFNSKFLMDFYRLRGFQTIWHSEQQRRLILQILMKSQLEGLDASDYQFSMLDSLENKFVEFDEEQQLQYDLQLSYNFGKFLTQLHSGKLDPSKIYGNWDLSVKSLDIAQLLSVAVDGDSVGFLLPKCRPRGNTYEKLIVALKMVNELPVDQTKPMDSSLVLQPYSSSNSVLELKKKLVYWQDLAPQEHLDAYFDEKCLEALKKFQKRHGLSADGVVGKGTLKALNATKEDRRQQIIANLERWRWYSRSFAANYVLINIADYSLTVVENQEVVMRKRIVVGKNKRKTPVLTSILQTIVFNPTWTVPPTILKEDVVPELLKDRYYLRRKGIKIYDTDSNEVNPLKWDPSRPRGYRYVQQPGYNNSLGVVKINFPNRFSVYMHDTDHRDLFDRNFRSLSSGCVRVEEPLELVERLLDNPKKYSREKMDSIVDTRKTLFIRLIKPYALYQWYWTAWAENEELFFRDDIYELDRDLYRKLRE